MNKLVTSPNIRDPDDFYAELIAVHERYDKAQSDKINAKLILLLANHIGDREVLREAFSLAVAKPPDEGARAGQTRQAKKADESKRRGTS